MSATEPQKAGQESKCKLMCDAHLADGLRSIRMSLAQRGEPFTPDDSNPTKELDEYFGRALSRISAAMLSLRNIGHLDETEIAIVEQDLQLANEIGILAFRVLASQYR